MKNRQFLRELSLVSTVLAMASLIFRLDIPTKAVIAETFTPHRSASPISSNSNVLLVNGVYFQTVIVDPKWALRFKGGIDTPTAEHVDAIQAGQSKFKTPKKAGDQIRVFLCIHITNGTQKTIRFSRYFILKPLLIKPDRKTVELSDSEMNATVSPETLGSIQTLPGESVNFWIPMDLNYAGEIDGKPQINVDIVAPGTRMTLSSQAKLGAYELKLTFENMLDELEPFRAQVTEPSNLSPHKTGVHVNVDTTTLRKVRYVLWKGRVSIPSVKFTLIDRHNSHPQDSK